MRGMGGMSVAQALLKLEKEKYQNFRLHLCLFLRPIVKHERLSDNTKVDFGFSKDLG